MPAPESASPTGTPIYSLLGAPGRVPRAVATNQLARFAPGLYVRLTGQTSRGAAAKEVPADIAQYVNQVNPRSHGLHLPNPLDFPARSSVLWQWTYSERGVPNRWRIDKYRSLVQRLPADMLELAPTNLAAQAHVAGVRSALAPEFHSLSDEDLSWLGFWLVMRKRAA